MMQSNTGHPAKAIEKAVLKFVETASSKLERLEAEVDRLKQTKHNRLQELDLKFKSLEECTRQLQTTVSGLRLKEINKHLVYKEQQAERLDQMDRTVSVLEVKVGTLDATVKKISTTLGKVEEMLHERLGPVMEVLQQQRNRFEAELRYVIAKQIEHVKALQPQLSELKKKIDSSANQTQHLKLALKELSESTIRIHTNESKIERIQSRLNELRDHLTAFVEESCDSTLSKSIELARERLTKPFEDLHQQQTKQLNARLDGLFTALSQLREETLQLINTSDGMADERYQQIFQAICEICKRLKLNNPLE